MYLLIFKNNKHQFSFYINSAKKKIVIGGNDGEIMFPAEMKGYELVLRKEFDMNSKKYKWMLYPSSREFMCNDKIVEQGMFFDFEDTLSIKDFSFRFSENSSFFYSSLPQNNIPVGNTLIIEEEKTEIKTVVFDFEGKKRAFAFSEGRELKIGRKNADVILKHSEVSSLHLLFSMTNGRLFFWNKGKNGTFINGVKVENGELNEGRYRFIIAGKYELLISVEREKSAESFYKGSLAPYFERIESWVYQTDLFSKHPIILITGESGSGKEIFAEFTHDISKRKGPFVTFNAAAVPETLVESELFGTAKGGFTDATDKNGGFLNADKGTLFLDEIAEMPVNLQSKLLRVLEDWQIKRVGESGNGKKVNVMVVLATNVNLEKAIE